MDKQHIERDQINIKETRDVYIQSSQLTSEERTEKDFREKLLTKVNNYWLHILEEKLSSKAEIELALETRSDLVKNPFSGEQEKINKPVVDTDIENIFTQWQSGESLLILGNPGAGKTIALLQLAKKFYNQAKEKVLEKPIPVVFHLSSWQYGQPIAEWLIQQLYSRYGFPQKESENWVKNQNLFLFLDGFDRVNAEDQPDCVNKINEFGRSNIVVCSRIQQYEVLPRDVRLEFDHAVCIKPLTYIQINNYLATLNKLGLKQVFDEDKKLLKLAEIPFWLNIMTDVHENLPREGSSQERKKKLFDEYIKMRFDRIARLKYDREKIIERLTWLASKSKSNKAESVFLIEEMQPSWLTKDQKKLYLVATLANGMLLGLLFGIPYGVIIHSYLSYSWGLSLGSLVDGIFLGFTAGLIIGTSAQYFLKVHKRPIKTHKEVILSWQKAREIFDKSFKSSIGEAIEIGGLVFVFCILIIPIFKLFILKLYNLKILLWIGLIAGTFFGVVTLIARLLSNSLMEKELVKTLKPNQGILDSRKKAYLMAKITVVILAIVNTLIILIVHYRYLNKLPVTLIIGLCVAVVTGGVAAFIHHSGRSCQQHLALRIVLWITGCIPWNYADFLDYASELTFLNKIGGGYQFFHGMFKEYLASLKLNQRDG